MVPGLKITQTLIFQLEKVKTERFIEISMVSFYRVIFFNATDRNIDIRIIKGEKHCVFIEILIMVSFFRISFFQPDRNEFKCTSIFYTQEKCIESLIGIRENFCVC